MFSTISRSSVRVTSSTFSAASSFDPLPQTKQNSKTVLGFQKTLDLQVSLFYMFSPSRVTGFL